MNAELTDAMVADMDSTANFMHQVPAPFPTIEHAVGIPPCRPSKLYTRNGLVTPWSRGISIPSREQCQKAADINDSIKRGGI